MDVPKTAPAPVDSTTHAYTGYRYRRRTMASANLHALIESLPRHHTPSALRTRVELE